MYQTRHSGASIEKVRGFGTLQEVRGRRQRKAFCSVVRYDKSSQLETLARRAEGLLIKSVLDVFGGLGFLAKATNHPGLSGYVLDTKFGPRYDVTKPLGRFPWKMCRRNDFTATTTHLVLSQSFFCQCGHRKLASSCSHALDSGTLV